MSTWFPIWNEIKTLEAAGLLVPLALRVPGDAGRRAMFLTADLSAALAATNLGQAEIFRYMALRARLEHFVTSPVITKAYLKPLRPEADCVWEIVNRSPKPSLRVFGLFATRDVFVATNHQLRGALGGIDTPQWKQEIRQARSEWRRLFQDDKVIRFDPLRGRLDEVISGAVYV